MNAAKVEMAMFPVVGVMLSWERSNGKAMEQPRPGQFHAKLAPLHIEGRRLSVQPPRGEQLPRKADMVYLGRVEKRLGREWPGSVDGRMMPKESAFEEIERRIIEPLQPA
jgi:hypothetical protein